MADAVTPQVRAELRSWLGEVARSAPQVVVKDPRSCWVAWLWAETAADLGIDLGFLTMIRHPAEVLGSRATYYRRNRPDMDDWQFSVMNLCGWINGNLIVERQTRGDKRVVIRYDDLVKDWRSPVAVARDGFGLRLNDDLRADHTHRVDDFVDAALRRHDPSWEGLEMPADLVETAEGVYDAMSRLADCGGRDVVAEADMDDLGARYGALMRTAQAIAKDTELSAARVAAARATAEARPVRRVRDARAVSLARRAYRGARQRLRATDR
jgi:hypothetical protein